MKFRDDPNQVTDYIAQELKLRTLRERGWVEWGIVFGRHRVYLLRPDVEHWVKQQDQSKWIQHELEWQRDYIYQFTDDFMTLFILRWS